MIDEQQNNGNQSDSEGQEPERDGDAGSTREDTSTLFSGDAHLQTKEEFELDKHGDHSHDDDTISTTGFDDAQTNSDGAAGTDRGGTAERKTYGDTKLNQGLDGEDNS